MVNINRVLMLPWLQQISCWLDSFLIYCKFYPFKYSPSGPPLLFTPAWWDQVRASILKACFCLHKAGQMGCTLLSKISEPEQVPGRTLRLLSAVTPKVLSEALPVSATENICPVAWPDPERQRHSQEASLASPWVHP